jgi:transcriptional regulator with GAF, ATPase, and Fis domain
MELARHYAGTDFPVLVTGESGTGKEVVAAEIHRLSRRAGKPFLIQNCSAIPETLLESELFGYKKGAFTGADQDRMGLFEAASGGTVFLDEIGDMPLNLQARILRVIQNGEVKPLGETRVKRVDVRLISATNKDLAGAVNGKEFRSDLYYRLSVLPLHVPPLRERKEDIPLLLKHFIRQEAARMSVSAKKIGPDAMARLTAYSWPGNVRELENFVKYMLVIAEGETITLEDLPEQYKSSEALDSCRPPREAASAPGENGRASSQQAVSEERDSNRALFFKAYSSWEELEKAYVLFLLEENRWNITRAAEDASVNRSTFVSRMRRLGIRK